MSFEHQIVQEDEDRWLNCDHVESLDNLDVVADQLRQDADHLESRFPANPDGSGAAQPVCADIADAQPPKSHLQRQMELCLNQVEVVLADRKKRKSRKLRWLTGLTAGIALAIIAATANTLPNNWRGDPSLHDRDAANMDASTVVRSLAQQAPVGVFSQSASAQEVRGLGIASAKRAQFRRGLKPTPVSFEIPSEFLHASGPEMEGLLDLYESDSTEAVTIEF